MCDASSYQPHGFAKDFNSCMQENVVTIYTCYEEGYANSYSVRGMHYISSGTTRIQHLPSRLVLVK